MLNETKHKLTQELSRLEPCVVSSLNTFLDSCTYLFYCKTATFDMKVVMPHRNFLPELYLRKICKRVEFVLKKYPLPLFLNIYVVPWDTGFRRLPETGKCISTCHINGGYAYVSTESPDIYVYHLEEMPKIILHEVFHKIDNNSALCKTDRSLVAESLQRIRRKFNVSEDCVLHVDEAIVETYATVYSLRFIAKDTGVPFNELFKLEMLWSQLQCNKILCHQNTLHDKKWTETSNAFCYIIIKMHLLKNYRKLMSGTSLAELLNSLEKCESKCGVKGSSLRMTCLGNL